MPKQRRKKKVDGYEAVTLPSSFLPLSEPTGTYRCSHALAYLHKRGVTDIDILRYNIGYCEDGEYNNRIIIPSYDADGQLNFFSSRIFYDDAFNPHKGPTASKNIVGFENLINWQNGVTLVEGCFDAISVRRNAIPLFGKIMPDKLKERIIENHVPRINMLLDNDAMRAAIRNSEDLLKLGVKVHLIKLEGKDPSVLGYQRINQIIEDSRPMGYSDLVYFKLSE
jgi:DNA primase